MMRAVPARFWLEADAQLGKHHTYSTHLDLERVMDPDFFMSVRSRLRAGDEIRVCQVIDDRVQRIADLLVVQVHARGIETMAIRDVAVPGALADPDAPAAVASAPAPQYIRGDGEVKWNLGLRKWQVLLGNEIVAAVLDKDRAYRIAQGDDPLPSKEAEAA